MTSILDKARTYLPLAVSTVDTDGDGVSIGGTNWRLRINTGWELVQGQGVVQRSLGPYDKTSEPSHLTALIGDIVGDIEFVRGEFGYDVKLIFRSSFSLHVESDFDYGEWIFSVWSEEDPEHVPIFDLQGPASGGC